MKNIMERTKKTMEETMQDTVKEIEEIVTLFLKKAHNIKVEDKSLVGLAKVCKQYGEKEIRDLLIGINGNICSITHIQEIDLKEALGILEIIKQIEKKQG